MKEESYYPEIKSYIEQQLKSALEGCNLSAPVEIFWGQQPQDFADTISLLGKSAPEKCSCLSAFPYHNIKIMPDIFGIITDGRVFKIIILEVKQGKSVGLKEWSQLLGYCLAVDASYGLLVNVDGDISPPLKNILDINSNMAYIERVKKDGQKHISQYGCFAWNSFTKRFEYHTRGAIRTIHALNNLILESFTKNEYSLYDREESLAEYSCADAILCGEAEE